MKNRSCGTALMVLVCAVFLWFSVPAKAGPTVSPLFVSSGLLAKADESAEEILLRAHQFDRGALILSIIGYYHGIGGFPKSPNLAAEWTSQFVKANDLESLSLFMLMMPADPAEEEGIFAEKFALCPVALSSSLAPLLKNEGLFDAGQLCADLEQKQNSTPNRDKRHAEITEVMKAVQDAQRDLIHAVRAFRDEPCSQESTTALYKAQQKAMPDSAPLYAATTHNPSTEPPDWSADRLLLFLDKLTLCTQQATQATDADREKAVRTVDWLTFLTRESIVNSLAQDREELLATIRTAHNLFEQDALKAMRVMAAHYQEGSPGFPLNGVLSDLWLQHAAFAVDRESRLLLALRYFSEKRYAEAWAWADAFDADEDADGQSRKMAARLTGMIEARAGKDVHLEGRQFAAAYFKAANELLDWLKKQPSGE